MDSEKQQLKAKLEDKGQGSAKPTGDESTQYVTWTGLDRRQLFEEAFKSQPDMCTVFILSYTLM